MKTKVMILNVMGKKFPATVNKWRTNYSLMLLSGKDYISGMGIAYADSRSEAINKGIKKLSENSDQYEYWRIKE